MYKELLIFPEKMKGQVIYPDIARELVAEAADAFPINSMIFSRMPDGKNVQGVYGDAGDGEGWGLPPRIFFGGGQGFIRVTGLGQEGSDLLGSEASMIATAVAAKLGPYSFKINDGTCTVQRSRPFLYRIGRLILSKKLTVMNAHKDTDGRCTLESVSPLIRRAIIGGIVSQARFLDQNSGGMSGSLESVIGTDDMLGLRIIDGSAGIIKVKKNERLHALVVSNLVFSLDLDLRGPWLAGILRSRGFGLIRKERV